LSDAYVLTAAAEADLRDIIRYTRQRWGDAQVRSYIGKLQVGIERVALRQGYFKDMTALYPGLRMAHCERHCIFGLPDPSFAGDPVDLTERGWVAALAH